MEWQPIETAPDAAARGQVLVADKWGRVEARHPDGDFWRYEKRLNPETFPLTYWMPLPDPPGEHQ